MKLTFLLPCLSNASIMDNKRNKWTTPIIVGVVIVTMYALCSKPNVKSGGSYAEPSISSTTSAEQMLRDDPYQVMSNVFSGNPSKGNIQPLMESVLRRFNMEVSNDQAAKVGNMLHGLSQSSKSGFSEMQLLEHINRHGNPQNGTLSEQAAIFSILMDDSQ